MSFVNIWHWLSLIIYFMTIVYAVRCLYNLHMFRISWQEVRKQNQIRVLLASFCTFLIMQSTLFIILQIDWITSNHAISVGQTTSLFWLFFDYFNGMTLLTFCVALLTYLKWDFCCEEKDESNCERIKRVNSIRCK
jgi:branched-subunit amino acid ABC-type transport system permease component